MSLTNSRLIYYPTDNKLLPHILARTVSNPIPFTGYLPTDRESILHDLRDAKERLTEKQLRSYRDSIESL